MFRLLLFLLTLATANAGFKKAISGGEHFFLFLQDDGAVLGLGDCHFGNFGVAGCATLTTPVRIALPAPAVDIAAGQWTSYAVLQDGSVYSWGSDENHMLGRALLGARRPSREGSPTPAPVPGLPKAVQITATLESVAVVTENGELWMWGTIYNDRNTSQKADVPRKIEGLPPISSFSMNERDYPGVVHMFALARDGSLWTWGYNSLGQLGNGTTQSSPVPKRINIPPVVSASAGGNNGVAVLADGTVRVWGGNDSSTMGNGQNVQSVENPNPVPVAGVTGAAAVSAGVGHIIVLLKNGTMRTWGHDGWGQAGIGTAGGYQMRPAAPKLTGVSAVIASRNRCFAITAGNKLWFWGPGYYRLPGLLNGNQKVPVELTFAPAATVPPQQTAFKPNAQLGVAARVGSITTVSGSKEIIETGSQREVTVDSVELALTFPNRMENIVATAEEKLLIIRGSLRNPEKTSTIGLGPSSVIGLRLAQRYTGTGKFTFVSHFDPDSLRHIQKNLKGGESARFVGVWRIPADFNDFRLGVTSDRPNMVAWYDFTASLGKLRSVFAAPDGISVNASLAVPSGAPFEIDGLEIIPGGVSRPPRIAGAAVDPAHNLRVVTITVTNRLLLPARWGWQYLTAEMIGTDGSVTKAYPNIVNQANDTAWAGDLAPGATAVSQFLFYPSAPVQPKTLRLTMNESKRQVEIPLLP